ncbi:MAG: FliH/SctL family protein [Planctomycetaceae bacterium]
MLEITVPLILPLRGVLLAEPDTAPPRWLQDQFSQLPLNSADRKSAATRAAVIAQQELELEQLRQERESWKRGLTQLQQAAVKTNAQCADVLNEMREVTVELAHAIASKLVFQQLAAGTLPIDRLVTEVLSRLNTREPITVRLHPEDLAIFEQSDRQAQAADSEASVRFIADPRLARGDCKAVAGEITVVYELRRQIEEIRRELLSTVNGHAEPRP